MREPKEKKLSFQEWLQEPKVKELLKPFEEIEQTEMEDFCEDFANTFPELAKELMEELEGEVIKRVEWHLEWRRQKEICFFTEEKEQEIKMKIKQTIWKVIVEDLEDYGF